ncbi:MAG: hypothetical protein EA381_01830 [Planctomycetaceae bacterium]|nr:MAG: hypothetical protein EA381_01830 [Planctomycetaceae bacterium]
MICFLAIVMTYGRVSGKEFSPTHFESRTFSFIEIPLLGIQLTPIDRRTSTSGFVNGLVRSRLVDRPASASDTWHLIEFERVGANPVAGAAKSLHGFLEYTDPDRSGNFFWDDWTQGHPAEAKVLWPHVQRLAIAEQYLLIPGLFRLASLAESPQDLAEKIDEYLDAELVAWSEDLRDAGYEKLADTWSESLLRSATGPAAAEPGVSADERSDEQSAP